MAHPRKMAKAISLSVRALALLAHRPFLFKSVSRFALIVLDRLTVNHREHRVFRFYRRSPLA